jgi:hypothetical protein
MAIRAVPIVLFFAAALGGCAPTALQLASFALDGAAYMMTGKGTTDLALSAAAGEDCRLSNAMKNKNVCSPPVIKKEAEIAAVAAGDALPRSIMAFVPPLSGTEIAQATRVEPAAGRGDVPRVTMHESAGMNVVEVTNTVPNSTLAARLDGQGTLHVFLVAPGVQDIDQKLFTVPGYRRNPGVFTGVLLGTRFMAPDSLIR